ncbi:hypothetical protein TRICI_005332 [Trichomonascus ciferrii]|uniref:Uncharacterized protein n=1 Tax=Trichomonascus ciferrii TaxID=44093 RepID=A0A642UTY8_9ASCO|nr:hypothetical protein TRICI_005332 [Trichomonascus ciferrii]
MFTGSFVELRKDLMSLNMPKFASTSEYNQKLTRFPNDYIKCHLKLAMEYEEYDYTPFLPPPISVSPIAPHVPIDTRVLFVARFSKSVPVDCDKWALRGQFFNAASLAFNLGPREFPGVLTTDGHSGTKVDTQTDIANPAKFLKLQDKRSKVFSYYKMQSRLDLKLEKCRYKTNGQKTKNGVNANLEQVLNKLGYSFSNFVVFLQYIGRLRDTLFQCHTAPYSQISDGNTTATEQRQNTSS